MKLEALGYIWAELLTYCHRVVKQRANAKQYPRQLDRNGRDLMAEAREQWEEVQRNNRFHQKSSVNGGSSKFSQVITFYVSNLPEGISDSRFKETFVKYGFLVDAYIAKKRDKGGNLFGFIRFRNVKEVHKLLVELNLIKLDEAKLSVNIAKYQKGGEKQIFWDNTVWDSMKNGSTFNEPFQGLGPGLGKTVASSSYKDALLRRPHATRISIQPNKSTTAKWWKGYSLMGVTKDLNILNNIVSLLESVGFSDGVVRYIGGLRILISFSASAIAKRFLVDKKSEWFSWFSSLVLWEGQDYVFDRIAILKVYGLPVKFWDASCFNKIGDHYGKIILGSSTTYHDCNLVCEKIVILTHQMSRINDNASVTCLDHRFQVQVCEDDEDWAPSFLSSSSELNCSERNQYDHSNFQNRLARVPDRCIDEEREEDELVEQHHDEPIPSMDGEGQSPKSSKKVAAHNEIPDEINESFNYYMEQNGPTVSKQNISISNDGSDYVGSGGVGMVEGLINTRPRKRPRSVDVEDAEVTNKDCNSNMLGLNNLDIHSLTPDLNLPPLPSNPKLRRRTRRSFPATTPSMVDVNVPSQNGTFRFGALENSIPPSQDDIAENNNLESRSSVSLNEVDETIAVGSLIGINLTDFRYHVEAVIGGEEEEVQKMEQADDGGDYILEEIKLRAMSMIPTFLTGSRSNVFDPFSSEIWDPFQGFSSAISNLQESSSETAAIANARIDWKETPEAHVFKADLPGLKKEEVKVEVEEGRVLQISGERSRENEEKNEKWHRVERSSGKFVRRFRLPENAKMEEVKAAMENGVLTVTVPKAEEKKPAVKSIDISS
ncbi:hypothetical protein E3N88_03338 [Mikania micrantha]|uniref:RRM domain-containing protein n=1 Tax=Mikania micrantha TaxID=192012 RepID=A0A5N6Q6G2_9ASTR|nr:hypothetical protein E3N88_03338 [Mikania micrantha]